MMSHHYSASDYAGFDSAYLKCYYGYERTERKPTDDDDGGEWCFVATFYDGEESVFPFSKLGATDRFNCDECLIAGIAKLFDELTPVFVDTPQPER